MEILNSYNIKSESQYSFSDLRYKFLLRFDFCVFRNDSIKCLIECNGQQHYIFKKMFHKNEENFIRCQVRDKMKVDYCDKNNYKLFIIKYNDDIELKMNEIINFILN